MRRSLSPLLTFLFLFLSACMTPPKKQPVTVTPPPAPILDQQKDLEERIDYPALQAFLGMSRDKDDLGFKERDFKTCDVGYGFSPSKNCRTEKLSVIHIHLLCRDSVGTTSQILGDADIRVLGRRKVQWHLKGVKGTGETDSDGYLQLVTSSKISQKNQILRVSIGDLFLAMRAKDINKVVTPGDWCDQY